MKVLYISLNNKGLGADTYEESGFVSQCLEQMTSHHIDEGDQGIVFLYLSEADGGFMKAFSKTRWPSWLIGVNMVVRNQFDQKAADHMARTLANLCQSDVIEFRPYPKGLQSEGSVARMREKRQRKWGWCYALPLHPPEGMAC